MAHANIWLMMMPLTWSTSSSVRMGTTWAYAIACHAIASLEIERPEKPSDFSAISLILSSVKPSTWIGLAEEFFLSKWVSIYFLIRRARSSVEGSSKSTISSIRSFTAQSNCSGWFEAKTTYKNKIVNPQRFWYFISKFRGTCGGGKVKSKIFRIKVLWTIIVERHYLCLNHH